MAPVLVAMGWELWRLSRWEIAFRALVPTVFWSAILYLAESQQTGLDLSMLTVPIFFLTVLTSVFSGLWVNGLDSSAKGFNFRLGFIRPVSTLLLVGVPMVYIATAAVLCYLIPAATLRGMFGLTLPLAPVAALVATACVMFVAAVWTGQTRYERVRNLAILCAIVGGMLYLWKRNSAVWADLGFLGADALDDEFAVPPWGYLLLAAIFGGCLAWTTRAVDRQRHLAEQGLSPVRVKRAARTRRAVGRASALYAQVWYEMRRSGSLILISAAAVAIALCMALTWFEWTGKLDGQGGRVWMIVLVMAPVVLFLAGTEWLLGLKRKDGTASLSLFDATQPMACTGAVAVKLAVLALATALGWALLAGTAAGWLFLAGEGDAVLGIGALAKEIAGARSPLWWGGIATFVTVQWMTLSALLLSTGWLIPLWPRAMQWGVLLSVAYGLILFWDAANEWQLRWIWGLHGWALALALPMAAVWAWVAALRKGVLRAGDRDAALAAWAVYVGAAAVAVAPFRESLPEVVPAAAVASVLSGLTVPLLAAAWAPLVLGWHRHR